jgi:hypothetical protein
MIKKIFISSILFISLFQLSHADNWNNTVAKKWFDSYSKKISIKYNIKNEIIYFEWFSDKLNDILAKNKFKSEQLNLVKDLIKLSNEYIFNLELTEKERNSKDKLKSNQLVKDFKYISYNEDNIFLENWVWYTYSFDKHLKFPEWKNISFEELKFNNIYPNSTIVFLKENNTLWFAIKYKKLKLITDSIIFWIPNKYNFLKEIKDDKISIDYDTDELFKNLKQESIKLTDWKIQSLKIKSIYDYVLNNVEYPKTFSQADSNLYSWIDTYKNKLWICSWYSKMFMYMLNFSNISNTEVVRWFVLDAQDFPKIWHAWIKIKDNYYDPTFDDPIWNTETKTYEKYNYFSLPKDLFYTNRYDYNKTPEYLKEKDLDFRRNFITKNIIPLLPKYKNSGYNLLKPYLLKLNKWIAIDKNIDIEDLKKIMGYYEVIDNQFIQKWIKKTIIKPYNYYTIEDNSIESLLSQIGYNFDWYYLFKFILQNWEYKYWLAYGVFTD